MSDDKEKAIFSENLNRILKERKKSQKEVADAIGVSPQTFNTWCQGIALPRMGKVQKLADYFMINKSDLIERKADTKMTGVIRIPVLGRVAAGVPIEMIDEIIDWEERRPDQLPNGKYFGLVIRGDSMEPRIHDKDVIIVRQQDDVESGDFAVVAIDGEDATCKRVMKYADGIMLMSLNSNYDPMQFTNEEITEKPVVILGKVVESVTKF